MRFILIVQSVLLVAAASYIYVLRQPVVESVPLEEVTSTNTPEEAPASTAVSESVATTTTVEIDMSGANDAGMEWPVFDEVMAQ